MTTNNPKCKRCGCRESKHWVDGICRCGECPGFIAPAPEVPSSPKCTNCGFDEWHHHVGSKKVKMCPGFLSRSVLQTLASSPAKVEMDAGDLWLETVLKWADNNPDATHVAKWCVSDAIPRLRELRDLRRSAAEDSAMLDWIFSVLNDDEISRKMRLVSDAHAMGFPLQIRMGDFRSAIRSAMASGKGGGE